MSKVECITSTSKLTEAQVDQETAVSVSMKNEESKSAENNEIQDQVAIVENGGGNLVNGLEEVDEDEDYEKIVFPPSSLWYLPKIATMLDEKTWAYIAINSIIVVRMKNYNAVYREKTLAGIVGVGDEEEFLKPYKDKEEDENAERTWPKFEILGTSLNEKYLNLAFCPKTTEEKHLTLNINDATLVTSSEKGFVRLWDIDKKISPLCHNGHKENKIAALEWSIKNPNLIYSGDDAGNLIIWDLVKNNLRSLSFGKVVITCIACSYIEDKIIAISTKMGAIFIINTDQNGTILTKLRHEEEAINVLWKPPNLDWGSYKSSDKAEDQILISSVFTNKSPTIRVWNRKGEDLKVIYPWEKEKDRERRPLKGFLTLGWAKDINDTTKCNLIVCGKNGEIFSWSSNNENHLLHSIHRNNYIFSVLQTGDIIWSFAYEPVIVGWNLRTKSQQFIIPTFKGVSYLSPNLDGTKIVFAGVDAVIRKVSLGKNFPQIESSSIPLLSRKLRCKITTVACHPYNRNRVAFGNEDGMVGIYDFQGTSTVPTFFDRRINGVVYTIFWGPRISDSKVEHESKSDKASEDGESDKEKVEPKIKKSKKKQNEIDLVLYICGNKSIFMVNPSKGTNELFNISNILSKANPKMRKITKVSEIGFAPDYSYLVVGYYTGQIRFFSFSDSKLCCSIHGHTQPIQYFSFRPKDFSTGPEGLGNFDDFWFASSSNDGSIRVSNLHELFTQTKEDLYSEPLELITSHMVLDKHESRVISLAWSPFDKNLLASASYDKTAIVWDIRTATPIARYFGHDQRLVCLAFHPQNSNLILTCGDEVVGTEASVHIWDYTQHPFKAHSKKFVENFDKNEGRIIEEYEEEENEGIEIIVKEKEEKEKKKIEDGSGIEKSGKKSKKITSILPLTSNALVNEQCSLIHELEYLIDKVPLPPRKPRVKKRVKPIKTESEALKETTVNGEVPELEGEGKDEKNEDLNLVPDTKESTEKINEEADEELNPLNNIDPAIHLNIFSDKSDILKLLDFEQKGLLERESWNHALILGHWGGNTENVLKEMIQKEEVNEMAVYLAQFVNKKVYLTTLYAYVSQLIDRGDLFKAATYLLSSNNMDKAIDMLMEHNKMREALFFAKLQVPHSTATINKIIEKWVMTVTSQGNYELAAKILCSKGDFSEAVEWLRRRNHPYAWNCVIYLSNKIGDDETVRSYGLKIIENYLEQKDYDQCYQFILKYPQLKSVLPNLKQLGKEEELNQLLIKMGELTIDEETKSENSENIQIENKEQVEEMELKTEEISKDEPESKSKEKVELEDEKIKSEEIKSEKNEKVEEIRQDDEKCLP